VPSGHTVTTIDGLPPVSWEGRAFRHQAAEWSWAFGPLSRMMMTEDAKFALGF